MALTRRRFLQSTTAGLVPLVAPGLAPGQQEDHGSGAKNFFLTGDFAPVREEATIARLQVVGKLPKDLNGFFIRNGPNAQFAPLNLYHIFEGDGMLHGVQLDEGKASYRNRYVQTSAWKKEQAAGKALFPSILDPVDWARLQQALISGEPPVPNRANTALLWHHGKLLALWEGGRPHEITLPDLGTVGEYTFAGKLPHNFTAHPKIDPRTGELIFFGYQPFQPHLQHSVADKTGTIKHTTPVPLPRPVMMHDAAITANYTVFIDTPVLFDLTGIVRGQPFLKWAPEHGARLGVLPRYSAGDTVKWFEMETCFVFHVFNAYEQEGDIVVHACRYKKYPSMLDFPSASQGSRLSQGLDNLPDLLKDSTAVAYTWRLNPHTGRVREMAHDDVGTEFPQVNQRRVGLPTRYGYCMGHTDLESLKLYKYDFETGQRTTHLIGKDRVAGEALFVPRDNAQSEDDGYLVTLTCHRADQQSELVVMSARDLTAEPLARVIIPKRIPFGFHATWIPAT